MYRVSLASIATAHNALVAEGSRMILRGRDAQSLARQRGGASEALQTTVNGTEYQTFVLGVHDPDDTSARWVV